MTPADYGPDLDGDPDARSCDYCGADIVGYGHPRGQELLCPACYERTFFCDGCHCSSSDGVERSPIDGGWYCPDCARERQHQCDRCEAWHWDELTEVDDGEYCEDCVDHAEAEANDCPDCPDCRGTGIGYPVDTNCRDCGGTGRRKQERDPDDWADERRDRDWDDRNEPRPAVDRGVDW